MWRTCGPLFQGLSQPLFGPRLIDWPSLQTLTLLVIVSSAIHLVCKTRFYSWILPQGRHFQLFWPLLSLKYSYNTYYIPVKFVLPFFLKINFVFIFPEYCPSLFWSSRIIYHLHCFTANYTFMETWNKTYFSILEHAWTTVIHYCNYVSVKRELLLKPGCGMWRSCFCSNQAWSSWFLKMLAIVLK